MGGSEWLTRDQAIVEQMLQVVFGIGKEAVELAAFITAGSKEENACVLRDLLTDPDVIGPVVDGMVADL